MKKESDRVRKLQTVHSREDRQIPARARACQKFDRLRIARNRTGTTIRPNDEAGKRLCVKISTGELLGGPGKLGSRDKYLTLTESREIAWVPQLGQMTKIGSERAQKLQPVRSP